MIDSFFSSFFSSNNKDGRMAGGKIYTRPGREAINFGICILSIRLSSNLGKIHTSCVNRINIWVPGPGDTAENSKRHGLKFWISAGSAACAEQLNTTQRARARR